MDNLIKYKLYTIIHIVRDNTLAKRNTRIKKSSEVIFIALLFIILLLSSLIYIIYNRNQNEFHTAPSDISLAGKWTYFAASKGDKFIGEDTSDGEYINLNKDGSASFKINSEVKDAGWDSDGKTVKISYGERNFDVAVNDSILVYINGDKKMYFSRDKKSSKYKEEILSKVGADLEKDKPTVVELSDENIENIYGGWYKFAEETKEKPITIVESAKEPNLIIEKRGKIKLDGKKGKWKLDDANSTVDVKVNKGDFMIVQINDKLILVEKGKISYYCKNPKDTEDLNKFINSVKETKKEKEGEING